MPAKNGHILSPFPADPLPTSTLVRYYPGPVPRATMQPACGAASESGGTGRRAGFRFLWGNSREGSTPSFRTSADLRRAKLSKGGQQISASPAPPGRKRRRRFQSRTSRPRSVRPPGLDLLASPRSVIRSPTRTRDVAPADAHRRRGAHAPAPGSGNSRQFSGLQRDRATMSIRENGAHGAA
jgi:hypothetical protein